MVDISTRHEKRDGEQIVRKAVELENGDVVEFKGELGGPYEPVGDEAPTREAVRALQEATDEDVELDVDDEDVIQVRDPERADAVIGDDGGGEDA